MPKAAITRYLAGPAAPHDDVAGRLDAGPGVAHHVDGPCEDGCGVQVLLRVQNGGPKAGQGAVQPVALGSRQRIRQCLEDKLAFGEISFLDPSWQWILDLFPNVVHLTETCPAYYHGPEPPKKGRDL